MVEFRLLGTLSLTTADGREAGSLLSQPRRLALLAYLAAATPRGPHRRDTLLALFWPELDQEHARAALRRHAGEPRRRRDRAGFRTDLVRRGSVRPRHRWRRAAPGARLLPWQPHGRILHLRRTR